MVQRSPSSRPWAPGRARRWWAAHARRLVAAAALGLVLCSTTAAAGSALDPRVVEAELLLRSQTVQAIARLGALQQALPRASRDRVYVLSMRGAAQAGRNDLEGAELMLRELDALRALEPSAASAANLVRGDILWQRGQPQRAERLYAEALTKLPADALTQLRMRAMRSLAAVLEGRGRYEDAVRLRHQYVALVDAHAPPWRQTEARNFLAGTLLSAGQRDAAMKLIDEALALTRQQGDILGEARVLTTMAVALGDAGDQARELQVMQRALELSRQARSREDEALSLGNLADHYLKTGRFEVAQSLANQALPLAREIGDPLVESLALANIGLSLIGQGKRDEGLEYARQSIAIDERIGALSDSVRFHEELGEYLERAGFQRDALQAYQRHRRLNDELYGRDQQRAVLELQESYEHDQRERELELLQRENRLKQVQLLNAELRQRVWLASGAVGVLLVALVGAMLHRLRQAGRQLTEGNALLQTQSERDPLTQLANRRYLQRVMHPESGGEPPPFEGSLLLVDLDHFKRVNDRHGHAAGDAVLVEVARRLTDTLRDADLVVRWGGEEFLIVAHELTQDQVQALAQRLLTAIGSAPVVLGDSTRLSISASIGYATFPTEPTRLAVSWERALDLVDTALYLAKAHGRNLAYGVRAVHARDETELVQISRGIEQAWSEGRVKLTPLHGPVVAEAAAPGEGLDR